MEERTITRILSEVSRFSPQKGRIIYSIAFGPVKLLDFNANNIIVQLETGETVIHDLYGRLNQKGQTLLYPEQNKGWEDFYKESIINFSDSKLRQGEVCLAKKEYTSPWFLAVYKGRRENSYIIQTSLDPEETEYAISWEDNKPLLGRCNFPEWFYDGE